jgi:hypothetical protein
MDRAEESIHDVESKHAFIRAAAYRQTRTQSTSVRRLQRLPTAPEFYWIVDTKEPGPDDTPGSTENTPENVQHYFLWYKKQVLA